MKDDIDIASDRAETLTVNDIVASGGSWDLGAMGPAILWGPLQW